MKKILAITKEHLVLLLAGAAAFTLASCLAGCGHNAVTYSDGVGVDVGFVPEQFNFSIAFRYGKIFNAVVKEKTKVSLTTDASNAASGKSDSAIAADTSTGVKTVLTLETGDQTTGYVVDLAKVKASDSPKAADAVVK